MIPDIDIFRLLLRSVSERSPLVTDIDSTTLNAHRRLLLKSGFAEGGGLSRNLHLAKNDQPLVVEYSLGALTAEGRQFVALSADEHAWERAKQAYEAADCDWSVDQLFHYLQKNAAHQ